MADPAADRMQVFEGKGRQTLEMMLGGIGNLLNTL